VVGSEAGRITLDALQTTGGYGYMNETPFPKLVRDFKIFEIFEGTNQIQREQISLQLVKEHAKTAKKEAFPQEMEEVLARAPHCGADLTLKARRAFEACVTRAVDASLTSDQYLRFLLADMLIDVETARAYCVAASRLEEQDPSEINTLTCRIFAKESALRTAARIRRFQIATEGSAGLDAVISEGGLDGLERGAEGLAADRRTLGEQLANIKV
jgi:alkylation response protein AidB-like acyl-CoA dehydrogenase